MVTGYQYIVWHAGVIYEMKRGGGCEVKRQWEEGGGAAPLYQLMSEPGEMV